MSAQHQSGDSRISDVEDAELARRAAGGDGEAFGALAERYGLAARRVARAILGVGEDADDAVQDGLIAAWRAIGRFDPGRPFRPWLMRIVTNAALDLMRRRKIRRTSPVSAHIATREPAPDRMAEGALLREKLLTALADLPERQRAAVVMYDAEGYEHADIAQVLGVPVGTVRSDVFHARRALRKVLGVFREE